MNSLAVSAFEDKLRAHYLLIDYQTTKEKKAGKLGDFFSFMLEDRLWETHIRFRRFKAMLIDKCYEILSEISDEEKKNSDIFRETHATINSVLRSSLCNKRVGNRYCKKPKKGTYCAFHSNRKAAITDKLTSAIDTYLHRDLVNIVTSYIDI